MSAKLTKSVRIPCEEASWGRVEPMLRETLAGVGLPPERKELICKSVEETLRSLARYSDYKGLEHELAVSVEVGAGRYKVVLADSLTDFAWAGVMNEDLVASEKPWRMGVETAQSVMDEISYTYKKGARSEVELIHSI